MSDAHNTQDHDSPHEGPIKTPKQLILAVFFSFVIPIAAIVLLVIYVTTSYRPAAGTQSLGAEAVARRIQPVGRVEIKDATDLASLKTGEQVYQAQCTACHTAGLAGAPKLGDVDGWAARIKTGYEALLTSALKGKGAMGAQGGGDFTDLEIGRAVVYIAAKAGGKFDEPKLPAASTAGAEKAAAATAAMAAAPIAPAAAPAAAAAPIQAVVATTAAVSAKSDAVPALYTQICAVCHIAGVANAPKTGDKAAWAPRLVAGIDALTASSIMGKGAMPPRGGSQASDAEIKEVVSYMVSQAK
jgi:cytochrome c5